MSPVSVTPRKRDGSDYLSGTVSSAVLLHGLPTMRMEMTFSRRIKVIFTSSDFASRLDRLSLARRRVIFPNGEGVTDHF